MTTIERQARHWAWGRHYDLPFATRGAASSRPVVLRFEVPRAQLAALTSLAFVDGHYDSSDFWSLVQHCRQSVEPDPILSPAGVIHDHDGPCSFDGHNWYDLVSGPVAAFWEQRSAMTHADQFSFHTPDAVAILNAVRTAGGVGFQVLPV